MKSRIIFSSLSLLATLISTAQIIPVEVVFSNKDYRFQHFFFKELKGSPRFGFFHTSSLYAFHDQEKNTEMMSQSYLTYKINPEVTALAGTFYASVPGFKASGGLQYKYVQNELFVMLAPGLTYGKILHTNY